MCIALSIDLYFFNQVKAQALWNAIIESQIETGTPYMLYKDACNGKSNQQNLGTIKCSNLCTEIVEYSSPDEVKIISCALLDIEIVFIRRDSFQIYFNICSILFFLIFV